MATSEGRRNESLTAAHAARIHGEIDHFTDLNAIIGPEAINAAKRGLSAVISDGNAGQCVSRLHVVNVHHGILGTAIFGRELADGGPSFELAARVRGQMPIGIEECLPLFGLDPCSSVFI